MIWFFPRHFLEHMVNPSKILEAQNLNKDGLIIIEVPNVQSLFKKIIIRGFFIATYTWFFFKFIKKVIKKSILKF